jgi:DNA-binding CsgD family transcriptional regulator
LSPRELVVLAKAANGLVDKEIAKFIDVQPATIRTYWDRLRLKLHAKNRTHAVSLAVALGWIKVDLSDLPAFGLLPVAKAGRNGTP